MRTRLEDQRRSLEGPIPTLPLLPVQQLQIPLPLAQPPARSRLLCLAHPALLPVQTYSEQVLHQLNPSHLPSISGQRPPADLIAQSLPSALRLQQLGLPMQLLLHRQPSLRISLAMLRAPEEVAPTSSEGGHLVRQRLASLVLPTPPLQLVLLLELVCLVNPSQPDLVQSRILNPRNLILSLLQRLQEPSSPHLRTPNHQTKHSDST